MLFTRETGSGQAQSDTTSNRYWIYVKAASYNEEGNSSIAFEGSQSIYANGGDTLGVAVNSSWNYFEDTNIGTVCSLALGGQDTDGTLGPDSIKFQGYFQDFRYWATPLSEAAFNEHVINSLSYKGNNTTSSLYDLTFRLPLVSNLNVPIVTGKQIGRAHV